VVGPVRRLGNSLVVVLPAKAARKEHITEGVSVRARVSTEVPDPFGLLRGVVTKGSFRRSRGEGWRDRF
jgi:hypothetical protein